MRRQRVRTICILAFVGLMAVLAIGGISGCALLQQDVTSAGNPRVTFDFVQKPGSAQLAVSVDSPAEGISAIAVRCGSVFLDAKRVSVTQVTAAEGFTVLSWSYEKATGELAFVVSSPSSAIRRGQIVTVECECIGAGNPRITLAPQGVEVLDSRGRQVRAVNAVLGL
jgi:hypothetical protein